MRALAQNVPVEQLSSKEDKLNFQNLVSDLNSNINQGEDFSAEDFSDLINQHLQRVKLQKKYSQKKINQNKQAKKTDPVSRYQNINKSWKSSDFLKANNNKQGRKLELDRFHKWSQMVHHYNQPQKAKSSSKVSCVKQGPTENRRDELRFNLRAKISQKNYVDRELRDFHFKSSGGGEVQRWVGQEVEGQLERLNMVKK